MSKQLVARALDRLVDGYVLSRIVLDDFDRPLTHISLGAPALANLIRAVDEQYPEGYDETGGYTSTDSIGHVYCKECLAGRDYNGHGNNCDRWNTRVALLNLCRDILGEKE